MTWRMGWGRDVCIITGDFAVVVQKPTHNIVKKVLNLN